MLAIAATTAREDGFPGAATQLISGSIAKAVAHSADEVAALHDAYVMRAELEGSNGLQDEALGDIDRAKQLEPALASEKHRARAVAFTARVEAEILSDHNPRLAYSLLTTAIDTAGRVGDGSLAELRYARAALLLQMGAPDTEIMTELRSGVDALDHAISGVVVTDRAEDTAERLYRHLVPMLIKAGAAREALDYCERYRRTAIVREGSRARTDSTFRPDRDPGIATVSYLFAGDGDRLCLFFSRKGQTIAVVEPISEELLAAIVNRLWRAADVATCEAALKELSLRLLYPLKLSLAGITTLVIAPDGILNRIPFAALRTSDGLHLIEHAAVVRMPFVYSNKAAMYERIDRHGVLVIGNPTFARREFRLLPDISESEREARAVAGLYDRSVIFVGADATRDAFTRTAPHASVIQIAAHAMSNEASPLDAALLLAEDRARRDDGVLYAREVAGLHLLHTRLVVLSTCTSGGAERTFSVGSLADAFITAGVHNVVDTLCDVRDAAASEFVMRFHSRLKSGQPIVTAFHNTQLEYSRRNCDLDCWAAFELTVGDLT
jgi:hypothetical protein